MKILFSMTSMGISSLWADFTSVDFVGLGFVFLGFVGMDTSVLKNRCLGGAFSLFFFVRRSWGSVPRAAKLFLAEVERGDTRSEELEANIAEAGLKHQVAQFLGAGEFLHRVGQVLVGVGRARNQAANERHQHS